MDGMEEISDYSSFDEEGYNNSETEEVNPLSMGDIFESFYRGIDDIFERLQASDSFCQPHVPDGRLLPSFTSFSFFKIWPKANMDRHESSAQSLLYQVQLVDEQIKIEQGNADNKKEDLFGQLAHLKDSIQDLMRNIQDSSMDGGSGGGGGGDMFPHGQHQKETTSEVNESV